MTWARGRRLRSDWWSASPGGAIRPSRTSHGGGAGSRARAVPARRPAGARRYSHLGLRRASELNRRDRFARADCLVGSREWALERIANTTKAASRRRPSHKKQSIGDGQNAAIGCLRDRRNPTKPRPAKPASIIAQVDGSGADDGRAPLKRLSLCNSPPPREARGEHGADDVAVRDREVGVGRKDGRLPVSEGHGGRVVEVEQRIFLGSVEIHAARFGEVALDIDDEACHPIAAESDLVVREVALQLRRRDVEHDNPGRAVGLERPVDDGGARRRGQILELGREDFERRSIVGERVRRGVERLLGPPPLKSTCGGLIAPL